MPARLTPVRTDSSGRASRTGIEYQPERFILAGKFPKSARMNPFGRALDPMVPPARTEPYVRAGIPGGTTLY